MERDGQVGNEEVICGAAYLAAGELVNSTAYLRMTDAEGGKLR